MAAVFQRRTASPAARAARNSMHGQLTTTSFRRCFSVYQASRAAQHATERRYDNEALNTLKSRQLLQDVSSSFLSKHLSSGSRSIYLGIDPTASSLHVGNLLPIIALIHLVKSGHKGVLLVGGATGSIGDPSGKTSERSDLPREVLDNNVANITRQLEDLVSRISEHLGVSDPLPIQVLNNAEFYKNLNILTFLKDVGRFVRIGEVLARDSVKTRLPPPHGTSENSNAGLSFTEFSYQLLQAYDFYLLNQRPDTQCTVQLGGSDQMGNIMAGVELIRRKQFGAGAEQQQGTTQQDSNTGAATGEKRSPPAYALTLPLLTTSSGEKVGKSAGNAVFLSPSLCSDYELYQYFLRIPDEDASKFITSLTFLNSAITQQQRGTYHDPRRVQKLLADEMITMLRGKEALKRAKQITSLLYGTLLKVESLNELRRAVRGSEEVLWDRFDEISATFSEQKKNTPWVVRKVKRKQCVGKSILDLFVDLGIMQSKAQVREALKTTAALHLNNVKINTPAQSFAKLTLRPGDVISLGGTDDATRGFFMLRRGKHDTRVILVEPDN